MIFQERFSHRSEACHDKARRRFEQLRKRPLKRHIAQNSPPSCRFRRARRNHRGTAINPDKKIGKALAVLVARFIAVPLWFLRPLSSTKTEARNQAPITEPAEKRFCEFGFTKQKPRQSHSALTRLSVPPKIVATRTGFEPVLPP